jgi:hypothetical protein
MTLAQNSAVESKISSKTSDRRDRRGRREENDLVGQASRLSIGMTGKMPVPPSALGGE